MRILATLQMVIGAAVLGAGVLNRHSEGSRLMLAGGINMATGGYLLLGDGAGALRYGALAVLVVLLIMTFATIKPATWRVVRVEMLLSAVLISGIVASQLMTSISAAGQTALLVVIAASGILLLALPVLRMLKWFRNDLVS